MIFPIQHNITNIHHTTKFNRKSTNLHKFNTTLRIANKVTLNINTKTIIYQANKVYRQNLKNKHCIGMSAYLMISLKPAKLTKPKTSLRPQGNISYINYRQQYRIKQNYLHKATAQNIKPKHNYTICNARITIK
eukprot:gene2802-1787_t